MPLPPNFSNWRHLRGTLVIIHNRRVKEWFKDITSEELSIADGRNSLRTACLIQPDDSAIVTANRLTLFDLVVNGYGDENSYYAMPISEYQERVKFKPQIVMLFRQASNEVPENKRPIESQIGFRLDEKPELITETTFKAYARKIDSIFGTKESPYRWQRGKVKVNYNDPDNGYRLQILAYSENEGKQVIGKVLQIKGDTLNNDLLTVSVAPNRDFRTGNETKFIAGESRKLPRERPIGYVRLVRAEMKIWGVNPDIVLVDYLGKKKDYLE